jgi:hypothetical protein
MSKHYWAVHLDEPSDYPFNAGQGTVVFHTSAQTEHEAVHKALQYHPDLMVLYTSEETR